MALSIWGTTSPPDNSGTWVDDGWGNWIQDTTVVGKVPSGYYDDGWGNLAPTKANPSLDPKTVGNINNALKDAKDFKDTAVGKVLYTILQNGQPVVDFLRTTGILKDPNAPISYQNLDKDKLEVALKSGTIKQAVEYPYTPPSNTPPTNSTYFGIDFSKPLTWVIVVLAGWGLYKVFNSSPQQVATVATKAKK